MYYALSYPPSPLSPSQAGNLKHIQHLKFWGLRDVLHDKYKLDERDAEEIAAFLGPMLEVPTLPDAFFLSHSPLYRPNSNSHAPTLSFLRSWTRTRGPARSSVCDTPGWRTDARGPRAAHD